MAKRARIGMTPKLRAKFLETLGMCGVVKIALTESGLDANVVYRAKDRDPEFAKEWEEAKQLAIGRLELTGMRLATYGSKTIRTGPDGIIYLPPDPVTGEVKPLEDPVWFERMIEFFLRAADPARFGTQNMTPPPLPADLVPDPVPTPDEAGPEKPVT